jgi:hypothetical protein
MIDPIKSNTDMTKSLKICTAAIVLFAAVASLRAQSSWPAGTRDGIAPMRQLSIIANDGDQSRPADGSVTHAGDPNSTRVNVLPPSPRSWFLFPLGLYSLPVVVLAVILTFKNRRNRIMHETLRAMIEKGMPVTPELIAALKPKGDARGQQMCYLLPGLICSAVGIGLMVNGGKAGLIPLLIGVAFLIAWQVEKRSTKADQPPGQ